MNWSRTLAEYSAYLRVEKGLSENSVQAYLSDLRQFQEFLQQRGRSLEKTDAAEVELYLKHLADQNLAPRSRARKISALKNFFVYLVEEDLVADNPCLYIATPKLPRRLPEILSEQEVAALLEAPKLDKLAGYRDRAMLEVLYASGLRVSELLDLDFTLGMVALAQNYELSKYHIVSWLPIMFMWLQFQQRWLMVLNLSSTFLVPLRKIAYLKFILTPVATRYIMGRRSLSWSKRTLWNIWKGTGYKK